MNLYKEWNQFADKGLKVSIAFLRDMIEEGNDERIRRAFKDFMIFFNRLNANQIKESMTKEVLSNIYADLMMQMRNVAVDEEFCTLFLSTSENLIVHGYVDISKFDELIEKSLPQIASLLVRDSILDLFFNFKELMNSHRTIHDYLLLDKESPFYGLPSFSLYTVKYGFGYDNLSFHMDALLNLFRNRKEFMGKRYREDVIFYLRFLNEVGKKMTELLKSDYPVLREEDILLMDKTQVELKMDLNKKTLPETNKCIARVLNRVLDEETLTSLFRFLKDFNSRAPLE